MAEEILTNQVANEPATDAAAKPKAAKKPAKAETEEKKPAAKKPAAKKAPAKATEGETEKKTVKKAAAKEEAAEKKPAAKKTAKAEKKAAPEKVYSSRLREAYDKQVVPALVEKFGYKNVNEVPKLVKIVINTGLGDIKDNAKSVQIAQRELELIAGQKPVLTVARKSVANFKVREGMSVGIKVTLRGGRMYDFFDKFVSIALPRVRDFRGVSAKSFDGRGNYAMGVKEQLIFPEISYDQVEKIRGFDVCFVTTAKTDEEAKELLARMGMPFKAN